MSGNQGGPRGLNILSFDGGGITGLSSLYIIREIMDRLQAHAELPTRPEPWEYFDLIGGTGTGAVSATMLGRLKIGLNDTIKLYHQLMTDTFSAKKRVSLGPGFKATILEAGLKKIVFDATGNANEMMMEEKPQDTKCKVQVSGHGTITTRALTKTICSVVYAMSLHNLNASLPCAFRTYPASANVMPDCPIWKALRASMAHPELFKSVEIEGEGLKHQFIGGALGCNNPTAELLKEASTVFPTRFVSTVTSVGAGHAKTIQLPRPGRLEGVFPIGEWFALRMLRATRGIAEDSEKVAEDLAIRFSRTSNIYFRLNVDQGMQSIDSSDWEKQNAVASHTRAYLQLTGANKHLHELVRAAQTRRSMLATTHVDGRIAILTQEDNPAVPAMSNDSCTPTASIPASIKLKYCPRPTFMFKGRKLQLEKADSYFASEDERRRVFVFHGLGGAGKTQTALKCAELMIDRFEGILFVDGTSRLSIEAALSQFAEAKHIGKEYTDALVWFEQRRARWLLLIDNVDTPDVRVHDYFPRVDEYDVLITTRNKVVAGQARGRDSDCKIDEMDPEEAIELLFEAARLRKSALASTEIAAASSLLQEFGYLALAIVQCGAFISRAQCTISQYYKMFLQERQEALEAKGMASLRLDDYERSVFTTWSLNKPLVGSNAEKLWSLCIPMHRSGISEAIFQRAYKNLKHYEPTVPAAESERKRQQEVTDILEIFAKNGEWNSRQFFTAMGELVCLSMIDLDPNTNVYRLHPLVQQWARSTLSHDHAATTAFLLALSISAPLDTPDHAYKRAMLPHLAEIMDSGRTPSPNNAWEFADVYRTMGNFVACEPLEEFVMEGRASVLGDDHPSTTKSARYLAATRRKLGRLKEAEEMLVKVVASQKQVLGDDHPDLLSSIAALAATYYDGGRLADAESLQVEVLAARKRVLGDDHPDTLSSMANLALTYKDRGRLADAESLEVEVLAARKRVLGDDHPDTLLSMANLAATYYNQGRLADAESLEVEVLAARKRVLGDDHPDTLSSMANLAATYYTRGRLADAESLEVEVLAARKRVLGDDHPDTLLSMANLAVTYKDRGRLADAESLEVEVLAARKRVLGDDHPDTLSSMANLALTYYTRGRLADAESLEVEVLAARKRVLGDDHPDTLLSMANLAVMYKDRGRLADAESLEVEVLAARKRVLGDDHPDTLLSMANLAVTYSDGGRLADAELLEVEVLAARKRVLGDDHPDTLLSMANLAATYSDGGRLADAESLEVEVLAARKRVLGDDHPATLTSMRNLSLTYKEQGRYDESNALMAEWEKIGRERGSSSESGLGASSAFG